ncbi:MAG: hypothetical protein UR28_C0014G0019 [Candidatus Peregrinibacteria bacterium GW2011_GWF2_33_10]|nr:MAG: hypothetical protein UR28_C0014G0019 [Candidatus Peregrinibacteria bacterium GW2011_GWF2_33_10]OGJ46309.1 MAG: YggS family pyridoxal phosphate enzyme [Candidatus Peregrinibacteria bacterium RIFOXYA12_FULL_33_12]
MIAKNIQKILSEIAKFPQKVNLVVVTKDRSVEEIIEVLNSGITNIGENRIQEAEKKYSELRAQNSVFNIKFHLIGHLQSNKVKKAVELFDVIQSVDSFELLKKIDAEAKKQNKKIEIMLQVNIFNDEKKFGFNPNEIIDFLKKNPDIASKYSNIEITGLMTIAKQNISEKETLQGFQDLENLKNSLNQLKIKNLEFRILSAGMSHDYLLALQSGSTMLRIGSKIFE